MSNLRSLRRQIRTLCALWIYTARPLLLSGGVVISVMPSSIILAIYKSVYLSAAALLKYGKKHSQPILFDRITFLRFIYVSNDFKYCTKRSRPFPIHHRDHGISPRIRVQNGAPNAHVFHEMLVVVGIVLYCLEDRGQP